MEKEIIEKLDLIINDRYKYYDAVIHYGEKIYKFKSFDISMSEYDFISGGHLRLKDAYYLLFEYKGVFITELWTKEFILNVKKEILFKEIEKTEYNLKGFYYMN